MISFYSSVTRILKFQFLSSETKQKHYLFQMYLKFITQFCSICPSFNGYLNGNKHCKFLVNCSDREIRNFI